jgi:uncharacterized protein (TIGR03067 family)
MRARPLPALVALAALAAGAFAPVPPPKPRRDARIEAKALEGTWKVISYAYRTGNSKHSTTLYSQVDIKDGQWVQVGSRKGIDSPSYTFKIDSSKSPATIDMARDGVKGDAGARRGVLKLEGKRLTVTYSLKPKPPVTKIDDELADGHYRWVLEREER